MEGRYNNTRNISRKTFYRTYLGFSPAEGSRGQPKKAGSTLDASGQTQGLTHLSSKKRHDSKKNESWRACSERDAILCVLMNHATGSRRPRSEGAAIHGEVEAGHMPPRRRKDDINAAWNDDDAGPLENPIGDDDVVGTGTDCDDATDGATRRPMTHLGQ